MEERERRRTETRRRGQGYESHERLSHCKHACNRDSSRLTWLSPWTLPMPGGAWRRLARRRCRFRRTGQSTDLAAGVGVRCACYRPRRRTDAFRTRTPFITAAHRPPPTSLATPYVAALLSCASEIARCNRVRVGYSRFGNRCNLRTLIKLTSGMRNGRTDGRTGGRTSELRARAGRATVWRPATSDRENEGRDGFRGRCRVTGVRWQIKTCQSNAISVQLDSNFN